MTLTSTEKHRLGMILVDALNSSRNAALAVGTSKETAGFREQTIESLYVILATDIIPALRKADIIDFWTEDDWKWLCDTSQLASKNSMPSYLRK